MFICPCCVVAPFSRHSSLKSHIAGKICEPKYEKNKVWVKKENIELTDYYTGNVYKPTKTDSDKLIEEQQRITHNEYVTQRVKWLQRLGHVGRMLLNSEEVNASEVGNTELLMLIQTTREACIQEIETEKKSSASSSSSPPSPPIPPGKYPIHYS